MKHLLFTLLTLSLAFNTFAKNTYKITYLSSHHGETNPQQDPQILFINQSTVKGTNESILEGKANYPYELFYINWNSTPSSYIRTAHFNKDEAIQTTDTSFLSKYEYEFKDEFKEILGYNCQKAVTIVNSNTIELWYTNDLSIKGSPVNMGQDLGLVLEYVRNGNTAITAHKIEKTKDKITLPNHTELNALDYQDAIWKSRFIQIPVFEKESINFTHTLDTSGDVLRFANGTTILKKVQIPELKSGTQGFVQVIQKSLGDAYDRTGSIFLIRESDKETFLDGMTKGMEHANIYENGNGEKYKGMVSNENFESNIELMRFFTPFGVDYFNERVQLKGKDWHESVLYRQDISELADMLSGEEVYIGAVIGNYDGGGHELSLELTFHPGWYSDVQETKVLPLFNTTSVMEMGGQGYPTMFDTEKGLKVTFELKEDAKNVQLRYITTGHGGWGGGDEFNQKMNSIYLDNEMIHQFIPWRVDCGSYRLFNPVSGNFQNGLSSSDLSRSNWCPATVTPPVYIELGDLKAGKHTIEVDIPQGQKEGTSFSYWNVSGILLYH